METQYISLERKDRTGLQIIRSGDVVVSTVRDEFAALIVEAVNIHLAYLARQNEPEAGIAGLAGQGVVTPPAMARGKVDFRKQCPTIEGGRQCIMCQGHPSPCRFEEGSAQ